MNNYFEVTAIVTLKQDIPFTKAYEVLSNFINKSMLKDEHLFEMHENKKIKPYGIGNLLPAEKDKTYHAGQVYSFEIRTFSCKLAARFREAIRNTEDEYFKIVDVGLRNIYIGHIDKLTCLTPCVVVKSDSRYWTSEKDSLKDLFNLVGANLLKKYNMLTNSNFTTCPEMFEGFKLISIDHSIPIPYKNTHFLGNKFELVISNTPMAQDLAKCAVVLGLGTKNSIGMGKVAWR